MNIMETAEKECAVLGALFQGIVNEMKVCHLCFCLMCQNENKSDLFDLATRYECLHMGIAMICVDQGRYRSLFLLLLLLLE